MSLQFKRTNRRQFIGRSALGAGSLLFAPLLLDSCTDHNIPPNGPIKPPLVGDDEGIDWNEEAKTVFGTAIGFIPEAGSVFSALTTIFWPDSGGSPWDQVKDQVEALVNQKFDDYTYNTAAQKLVDLKANIDDYREAVTNGTALTTWVSVHEIFVNSQGVFTATGYEVILLPLFTQFANMFLTLLRDAVFHGYDWGMPDGAIGQAAKDTQDYSAGAVGYVSTWYVNGRSLISTGKDDRQNEPFTSLNRYDRQMTMLVLDYMDTWQYYNTIKYSRGAVDPFGNPIRLFTREIYSDPYGNTWTPDSPGGISHPIVLPSPATQFPTQITVWAGHRIDAVQLTYPAGGGPGGVTTTPRMGDSDGGSPNTFTISPDLPIIRAVVSYDNAYHDSTRPYAYDQVINTLQFIFSNGNGNTLSPQMGANTGQFQSGYVSPDGYALSSIYIHGVDYTYGNSADCIVFGFMRWPPR